METLLYKHEILCSIVLNIFLFHLCVVFLYVYWHKDNSYSDVSTLYI